MNGLCLEGRIDMTKKIWIIEDSRCRKPIIMYSVKEATNYVAENFNYELKSLNEYGDERISASFEIKNGTGKASVSDSYDYHVEWKITDHEIEIDEEKEDDKNLCLTVAVFKSNQEKLNKLYDCIPTFEKAYLLSQLAMKHKDDDELVVILPGWNIKLNEDEMKEAKELADKYKEK